MDDTTKLAVLFVDDEQPILSALKRAFYGMDQYVCHFANSPMAALEVLTKTRIAVMVSDHKMPQMTGAEFLARVKDKRPDTVRIMLTGQADLTAVQDAINRGEIFRFLLKPWNDAELKHCVAEAAQLHLDLMSQRVPNQSAGDGPTQKVLEDQIALRTQQLADALYTARSLRDMFEQTLYAATSAMCWLVEMARPELGRHCRNVAEVAVALGKLMNLSERDLRKVEMAGRLHDCGKLSIPAYLSDKSPREYNSRELDLYRTHPGSGAELFRTIEELEDVREIIRTHHERFDGSGFPEGLRGARISLLAYLVGIANEYDHLMNKPSPSPEFRYQFAYETLSEMADKQFPAVVVQTCLDYAHAANVHQGSAHQAKVGLSDLIPNSVLSRDIYTRTGCLLLAQGSRLTNQNIARIRSIARLDPIAGDIFVSVDSSDRSVVARTS